VAEWEQGDYPKGIEVTDAELAALPLSGHDWHRNYDLTPRPRNQRHRGK